MFIRFRNEFEKRSIDPRLPQLKAIFDAGRSAIDRQIFDPMLDRRYLKLDDPKKIARKARQDKILEKVENEVLRVAVNFRRFLRKNLLEIYTTEAKLVTAIWNKNTPAWLTMEYGGRTKKDENTILTMEYQEKTKDEHIQEAAEAANESIGERFAAVQSMVGLPNVVLDMIQTKNGALNRMQSTSTRLFKDTGIQVMNFASGQAAENFLPKDIQLGTLG